MGYVECQVPKENSPKELLTYFFFITVDNKLLRNTFELLWHTCVLEKRHLLQITLEISVENQPFQDTKSRRILFEPLLSSLFIFREGWMKTCVLLAILLPSMDPTNVVK